MVLLEPSPKSQFQLVMVPGEELEVSIKVTVGQPLPAKNQSKSALQVAGWIQVMLTVSQKVSLQLSEVVMVRQTR